MSRKDETHLFIDFMEYLKNYSEPDRMQNIQEIVNQIKNRQPIKSYRTKHLTQFDEMTDGFEEGELITLSGATGQGKSLVFISLIAAFAEQDLTPVFFSYEMTLEQIIKKFDYVPPICFVPGETRDYLKYPPELEAIRHSSWYLPASLDCPDLEWIWVKINELRAKQILPRIIFIDHLHYLADMRRELTSGYIGSIMRGLKKIALNQKVVIMLTAHTTKEAFDREPSMADIRDSSFVAQESDIVLVVWRKAGSRNEAFIKIDKHRRTGILATIPMIKHRLFLEEASYEKGYSKL